VGDDVDEYDDTAAGKDRVTIPRFVVLSVIIFIARRRWLDHIVVSNCEQVILNGLDELIYLDHSEECFALLVGVSQFDYLVSVKI